MASPDLSDRGPMEGVEEVVEEAEEAVEAEEDVAAEEEEVAAEDEVDEGVEVELQLL